MPHDRNGMLLREGDQVYLPCVITHIGEGDTACNVDLEAAERPEGEGYVPTIACNSRFVIKRDVGAEDVRREQEEPQPADTTLAEEPATAEPVEAEQEQPPAADASAEESAAEPEPEKSEGSPEDASSAAEPEADPAETTPTE